MGIRLERQGAFQRALSTFPPDWSVLDDAEWRELLLQDPAYHPSLAAFLPRWPSPSFQAQWVGTWGRDLDKQTWPFYQRVRDAYERLGPRPLKESHVLDYGCGFGRILRYFIRDTVHLHAVDVDPDILDLARDLGLAADYHLVAPVPEALNLPNKIDLAFAFSVFTHVPERAHLAILQAIHAACSDGALFFVTVRPPGYANLAPHLEPLAHQGDYAFLPHLLPPVDGEVQYGETIIAENYIRMRWRRWFEVVESWTAPQDPYQVGYVMRKVQDATTSTLEQT